MSTKNSKYRKNKAPGFIPNRPLTTYNFFSTGEGNEKEREKNVENQKKLALRNK